MAPVTTPSITHIMSLMAAATILAAQIAFAADDACTMIGQHETTVKMNSRGTLDCPAGYAFVGFQCGNQSDGLFTCEGTCSQTALDCNKTIIPPESLSLDSCFIGFQKADIAGWDSRFFCPIGHVLTRINCNTAAGTCPLGKCCRFREFERVVPHEVFYTTKEICKENTFLTSMACNGACDERTLICSTLAVGCSFQRISLNETCSCTDLLENHPWCNASAIDTESGSDPAPGPPPNPIPTETNQLSGTGVRGPVVGSSVIASIAIAGSIVFLAVTCIALYARKRQLVEAMSITNARYFTSNDTAHASEDDLSLRIGAKSDTEASLQLRQDTSALPSIREVPVYFQSTKTINVPEDSAEETDLSSTENGDEFTSAHSDDLSLHQSVAWHRAPSETESESPSHPNRSP